MDLLIIGAGGLGCGLLVALLSSCSPLRSITIIDPDYVEAHNLHRQVLFSVADIGAAKAEVAAHRVRGWACGIGSTSAPPTDSAQHQPPGSGTPAALRVQADLRRADADSLRQQLRDAPDNLIVAECSDSARLKFVVNDLCVELGRALVIGGVIGVRGTVFARSANGPSYRALFESPPSEGLAPDCAQAGVLGVACGVVGSLMAGQVVSLHTFAQDARDHRNAAAGVASLAGSHAAQSPHAEADAQLRDVHFGDEQAHFSAINLLTLRRQDLKVLRRQAA